MNRKIQKIAVDAGIYMTLSCGASYPKSMSSEESERNYQKFAELIIIECAKCSSDAKDIRRIYEWFEIPVEV